MEVKYTKTVASGETTEPLAFLLQCLDEDVQDVGEARRRVRDLEDNLGRNEVVANLVSNMGPREAAANACQHNRTQADAFKREKSYKLVIRKRLENMRDAVGRWQPPSDCDRSQALHGFALEQLDRALDEYREEPPAPRALDAEQWREHELARLESERSQICFDMEQAHRDAAEATRQATWLDKLCASVQDRGGPSGVTD